MMRERVKAKRLEAMNAGTAVTGATAATAANAGTAMAGTTAATAATRTATHDGDA
jgi:hypothetical protein